jgi:hypothetical protein
MPSVKLTPSRSSEKDPARAAEELLSKLGSETPKLAVVYASRDRDLGALIAALRARLPKESRIIGGTTNGEIDNQGLHEGSVVLGSLTGDFEAGVGFGRGLTKDAMSAGAAAMQQACEQLGIKPYDLNARKHVGLVLDDGTRHMKEELLLGVMEKNQQLVVVGGGASSPYGAEKLPAFVAADGETDTDAVVTVVFSTDAPWAALRSHWYHPTGRTIRITKVGVQPTIVQEIDGKPAAAHYAELLGVGVDDLEFGKPNGFSAIPAALRVGREYFLRAPWKVTPDGSILFANTFEEGQELELVKMGNAVDETRKFFTEEVPRRVTNPTAGLFWHCSGRMWVAHSLGVVDPLMATFADAPPCVGLNADFEIYCGFNINTTLTSLVFGAA